MIKIQINNPIQKKQEYLDAILKQVASRVSVLQQSLTQLNGGGVDFSTGDFVSFKAVTKNIIELLGDNIKMQNRQVGYTDTINNYLAVGNSLGNINIAGLIQFCNDMLATANQKISELLVCDAADLMNQNTAILNNYVITTDENIAVIKLAFDYSKYNADISFPIRGYFREKEFVKFCPYCNIKKAYHHVNAHGQVVESYELDHFYDKATYPLLSYSLFNLVPSDHTCNVTNKGVTLFTDEYHLNPHQGGYSDRIKFRPNGLSTSYEVSNIEVEILEAPGTDMYKRINGVNIPSEEQGSLGNINVFKLRSHYLNETHKAGKVLEKLHETNKNINHIKKYLKSLGGLNDRNTTYKVWYEKEFGVNFSPLNFNTKSLSKFHRDLHDYYFSKNKSSLNKYIQNLIQDN